MGLNVFQQIDSICREFRKAWQTGEQVHFDDLLRRVPDDAQPMLFRNLLMMEIEFRRRNGEYPNSSEYVNRFPRYTRDIRQVFLESTMMSIEASVSMPQADHDRMALENTESMAAPAANRLGNYELIEELGRGGFGVVYKARHVGHKNLVALKTLPIGQDRFGQSDAERLHKFRREFRALADVNHPNLVGMQTLEVDGIQWFFTMDLVNGVDLISWVRPKGELDEERLRTVLPQLASGVMALHSKRIIHRDLKPTNVLVDDDGKVSILDFGLVVELQRETDQTQSMQSSRFAGTPVYAAPEQLRGNTVSESDWYAFGVIVYEALTGERPFSGTLADIIHQKRDSVPSRLTGRSGIPTDLAQLADDLLNNDIAGRPGPLEIAKACSIQSEPLESESAELAFRATSDESGRVLIGRDKQLAELNELRTRLVREHQPLAVFITGKSGEGKTWLAEKFLEPLRLGTVVLVLSGRCYDRESVPFKAIDAVSDSLVGYLRDCSDEYLNEVLPDDIEMLAQLFPVLRRVKAIAERSKKPVGQLDSKQIRARAFNALTDLLASIGQQSPVVVFVDDLQWGDSDSADVFFRMLTSAEAPAVLFVGSYRRDEADESPFVRTWEAKYSEMQDAINQQPDVVVAPLTKKQCQALLIHRFGDSQLVRRRAVELHTSTGGNPYFLDELIESFDPETGSFTPKPLGEVIEDRLNRLPSQARPLLNVISAAVSAVSIGEACQVVGLSETAIATFNHMRNERLVRSIGADEDRMVDTYHDKIRETVLDGMDAHQLKSLHLSIGQVIERACSVNGEAILEQMKKRQSPPTPERVFDLAYHFKQAQDRDRALAYSLLAAEQATRQYALPNALEQYSIASDLIGNEDGTLRYRLNYGHGSVLSLTGEYDLATKCLQRAAELADDQLDSIEAKLVLADIVYKTRSLTESAANCERLLGELGVKVPRSKFKRWMSITKNRFVKNRTGDARRKIELTIKALLQYAYACLFTDREATLWSCDLALKLAKELRYKKLVATCSVRMLLVDAWLRSDYSKVVRSTKEAEMNLRGLSDTYGDALLRFHYASACYMLGHFREADEELKAARTILGRLGDLWRQVIAGCGLSQLLYQQGNMAEAATIARQDFEVAARFGQYRLAQMALSVWLNATGGQLPADDLVASIEPVTEDLVGSAWLNTAMGLWHLRRGASAQAVGFSQKAVNNTQQLYRYGGWACAFSYAVHAEALREHADALSADGARAAPTVRKEADSAARLAVRLNQPTTFALPYALRELAHHKLDKGRVAQAERLVRRSLGMAQARGATYEFARSMTLLAEIAQRRKDADAPSLASEANALMEAVQRQFDEAVAVSVGGNS